MKKMDEMKQGTQSTETSPVVWKLETVQRSAPDKTLATGTEAEVKAAAVKLFHGIAFPVYHIWRP